MTTRKAQKRSPTQEKCELAVPAAYRINDAAWYLGLSRTSLYELAKQGRLTMIRVAGRRLILRSELDRFLAEAARDSSH